ncbi:MAG: hypothetical protein P4L69_08090, partial [Desulfosporosinus sp.]|nr:hypothetical protein [Desulfosporosinus sp.]
MREQLVLAGIAPKGDAFNIIWSQVGTSANFTSQAVMRIIRNFRSARHPAFPKNISIAAAAMAQRARLGDIEMVTAIDAEEEEAAVVVPPDVAPAPAPAALILRRGDDDDLLDFQIQIARVARQVEDENNPTESESDEEWVTSRRRLDFASQPVQAQAVVSPTTAARRVMMEYYKGDTA